MFKAAALYYAIVISLLIGVMSAMLLLYTRYSLMELSYYDIREQLIRNSESGILLLSRASVKNYQGGTDISLYGDDKDSVYLKSYAWGVYCIGISRAHQSKFSYTTTAFLGCLTGSSYASKALYVADHQTALGFCGKAKIKGDACLPKMGTRLNFVEGKTAESGSLVDGKITVSQSSTPALYAEDKNAVEAQYGADGRAAGDTVIQWPLGVKKLYRGYAQSTIRIELPANATLSDITLRGNIKVLAPISIKIDSSAHLNGALVICPKIELQDGCTGSMQLLASDTVFIRQNCMLQYPSSIYMRESNGSEQPALLYLENGAHVQGEIYQLGSSEGKSEVQIDNNAYVQGLVYAGDRLVLKGKVDGTVVCDKFYLKTATAIYENQLLDGRIDRDKLPKEFLYSRLLMNGTEGMISHATEK